MSTTGKNKTCAGLLLCMSLLACMAQAQKKQVYLLPGQGADWALFTRLELNDCDTHIIRYPVPVKHETMAQYARRLSQQIDTTQPFYLVGVSFGGMNAIEMGKFLHPEKIILISSAKGRNELPFRYKFQRVLPVYKLFSGKFYKRSTQMARHIFEPDCRPYDSLFRAMILRKDPKFMKRSIDMIVHWKNKEVPVNVIHIHGTKDHTLPYRKIKPTITVDKGSHMMVYTQAEKINALVNESLK